MLWCLAREPMNRSKERAKTFVVALNEYVTWEMMMISLQQANQFFFKNYLFILISIIINLS
jgi:hypothetical protein